MQKARNRTFTRRCIVLSRLVDTRFQVLFTPLAGVLFAFPSRYWFAIGRQVVFSLGRWSSRILAGLLEPRDTQDTSRASFHFTYAAVTLFGRPFQAVQLWIEVSRRGPTTPKFLRTWVWALPLSLATTSGISDLISFPQGTKMFQFPWLATSLLCIQREADPT
jgi:hypothetical protein